MLLNYFSRLSMLIFFVYPDPKGSEEPTKRSEGVDEVNQFTPLGDGVNKLIFERW